MGHLYVLLYNCTMQIYLSHCTLYSSILSIKLWIRKTIFEIYSLKINLLSKQVTFHATSKLFSSKQDQINKKMIKCHPSIPQFIGTLKVKSLKSYSTVYWVSTLTTIVINVKILKVVIIWLLIIFSYISGFVTTHTYFHPFILSSFHPFILSSFHPFILSYIKHTYCTWESVCVCAEYELERSLTHVKLTRSKYAPDTAVWNWPSFDLAVKCVKPGTLIFKTCSVKQNTFWKIKRGQVRSWLI